MLEGSVMSIGKMWLFLFMIFAFFSIATFFINVNKVNDFRQFVNSQIERNGGLSIEAISSIDKKNIEDYHGQFKIESNEIGKKLEYGTQVTYTLSGKYRFFFLNLPVQVIKAKGSALSLIR